MGFLDQIDDPNALAALLGITGGAGGSQGPGGPDGSQPPGPPPMPPQPPAGMAPMPQPPSGPNAVSGGAGDPSTNWSGGGPQKGPTLPVGMMNQAPGAPPMGPPPDGGVLPPGATSTIGGGPRGNILAQLSGQPPGGAPPGGGGFMDDFRQRLSANLTAANRKDPTERASEIKAGLGKAMAGYKVGTPAGAAFFGGAGRQLEGESEEENKQKAQNIAKLNSAIHLEQQRTQSSWYAARAKVLDLKANQDASSKAWQMSDPGRYHLAETEVQKQQTAIRMKYQDELKQASGTGDQEAMGKIRKLIDDETAAARKEIYSHYQLDPATAAEKAKRGYEGPEDKIKHLLPGTRFWDAKAGLTRIRGADEHSTPVTGEATSAAQPGLGDIGNAQMGAPAP